MNSASEEKKVLRQRLRQQRRAVDTAAAASAAGACAQALAQLPAWQSAETVALYLPNDGELDTGPIVSMAGERRLYLPRVCGKELEFAPWQPGQALARQNRLGIAEPDGEPLDPQYLDLLLLPLVAFDSQGVRLGMGGGYYDRCLGAISASHRPPLVGLGYSFQRWDALPRERWDVLLDGVVTEEGALVINRPRLASGRCAGNAAGNGKDPER